MTTQAFSARKAFLIVDDEPLFRMDLGDVVRECGFETWEAANTAEALAVLEGGGESFAGLITDINMPGTRSGLVLANHVRWMWPHISIIVISGARLPMNGELPERVEFLAKPVPATRLATVIHASMRH